MKKVKKNFKQENGKRSIKMLWASFAHGILICAILLISVSWAWFTQIVDAPDIKIRTAEYGINAKIQCNGAVTSGDCGSFTDGNGLVIEVESGKVHDVTLTALGNALRGGYCVVSAGDDLHYTVPIGGENHPENISFQIFFGGSGTGKIEFLPYWGTYPNTIPETKMIPVKDDILKHGFGYVVSDGDIVEVTSGNAEEGH